MADVYQVQGYTVNNDFVTLQIIYVGPGRPLFNLQRRIVGAPSSAWITVIPNVAEFTLYTDHNVASGINYEYRARTLSGSTSHNTVQVQVDLEGTYIHDIRDPMNTFHQFRFDGGGSRNEEYERHREFINYVETPLPEVKFGDFVSRSKQVELLLTQEDKVALERILRLRRPVMYRDKRGTKIHGLVSGSIESTSSGGFWRSQITVRETDFNEDRSA